MARQMILQAQAIGSEMFGRRAFLKTVGLTGVATLGWKDAVALHADELRKKGLAVIVLFMRGGPSQFETFDPKPGTTNGGPTEAIETAVPGIQLAKPWTNVAKMMKEITLIRSMTNKEGEHQRATYQMHTGYEPNGSVKYPAFGATVASELGRRDFDLPHYVFVGPKSSAAGAGVLGADYEPFSVANPTQMPNNVTLPRSVAENRFNRRLDLLKDLEQDYADSGAKAKVTAHQSVYNSAAQLVLSPRLKAFDLSQEKESVKRKYGTSTFGQGCLLARRLVEEGVTFVEVESNGWDTHEDNFDKVKSLSETVDPGFASLVEDLKERGRLDKTLVVWLGEFGRTPRINTRGTKPGRDHYPRAFNIALAGAGIQGGRVIGGTSADGSDVKSRPVSVPDLFQTFCKILQIKSDKTYITSLNRPIKIVDGGKPVEELF